MARIDATFRPRLLNFTGTEANDTLTGTSAHDDLFGLGGNDHLIGLDGDDQLYGGTGADTMEGGAGHDHYYVDNAADLAIEAAGAGTDNVHASVSYALAAGSEVENLFAADTAGTATLNLTGNELDNLIYGTNGVNLLRGGGGDDLILAGGGADFLSGGAGADKMFGGVGNDTYYVDNDGDSINELANGGLDRVAAAVSYVLLGQGAFVELLEAETLGGIERLDLTGGDGGQTISGNQGVNVLDGRAGGDVLHGYGGNDYLIGGGGDDKAYGGLGDDTYYVGSGDSADILVELAGEGRDRIATAISFALAADLSIELLEAIDSTGIDAIDLTGNAGDQVIAGNAGANILSGEDGNDELAGYDGGDTLNGGLGDDILNGGAGDDMMAGGPGNDTYYVTEAGDVVAEAGGDGFDIVATSITYALAAGAEIEVLQPIDFNGTDMLDFIGNELANTIYGNEGHNHIHGGAGNDTLIGGGGADLFIGGDGDDTMVGGDGSDTFNGDAGNDVMVGGDGNEIYFVTETGDIVSEAVGEGFDMIRSDVNYTLAPGAEIEDLQANTNIFAPIALTGNEFGQAITGLEGDNVLDGKGGDDVLNGKGGADILVGGEGADSFAFTAPLGSSNVDLIKDFTAADDTILLDHIWFVGLAPGALPASAFVIGSKAGDADDRIIYDAATGSLYFDADGNGVGAQQLFASLAGLPPVEIGDFTVI